MGLIFSLLDQNLDPGSNPSFNTVINTGNIGTMNTGVTGTEYGDGYNHTTKLTISTTLPAIAGGAALGVGKLIYTFPAGAIVVGSCYMTLGITQTQGNINADTPAVGIGTTIASGVISVLSGTAAFENVIQGKVAANCTGTATVKTDITQLTIDAADDHTVYINAAATWAASGDAAAILTGTVVLDWQFLN